MAVEIAEVEFEDAEGTSVVKRREVFWVIRFEIVERKADTIAQDDIARQLAVAALAGEVVEVDEGLGFRFGEGSFGTLVLDQEDSRPKQIENPVGSPCRAYGVLKYGHALACAEYRRCRKFVPERLFVLLLMRHLGPFAGEADGAVAGFVPEELRHGEV